MASQNAPSHSRISYTEFTRQAPAVREALLALGKAVDDSGLEKSLTELLKLRASQLNGCAFCLQYHLNVARKAGVPGEKLDLVATWREAGIYTPRESAALAWTEALTRLDDSDEDAYEQVVACFEAREIPFLAAAIGSINAWNRIAGPLRFAPPIPGRNHE